MSRPFTRKPYSTRLFIALVLPALLSLAEVSLRLTADEPHLLIGGAAELDISPKSFPVIISGGFLQGQADRIQDPLHVRAIVLDDGTIRLAIAIVDTLMMPRELIDDAKQRITQATGIAANRVLIAATHSHTAPSVMGALGTGVDKAYAEQLPGWIAECVTTANRDLVPVRVGWTSIVDRQHTNCRRWITRLDRIGMDPFGEVTIHAMMHPGYQNPDYIGPAGPEDPGLTLLAIQRVDGTPLAILANYSMHYFGTAPVSADYFGRFCARMQQLVSPEPAAHACIVAMSQGTAGDLHWMDYSQPATGIDIDTYSREVTEVAFAAWRGIEYRDQATLAVAQRLLTLERRVPDGRRLEWAKAIIVSMQGRTLPQDQREVYALEQMYLHNEPARELVLQAMRIGDLGLTAIPAEVYGITGLKLKGQSPLPLTMNLELANGADGYIPPPEQHRLGGYTTWPARTAGLEVAAEPKIVECVLQLLEEVAGKPRASGKSLRGPYTEAVLSSKPIAYWRLHDMAGSSAADLLGGGANAEFSGCVAYYLDGPPGLGFVTGGDSRAAHFAGGCLTAKLPVAHNGYTWEAWLWNGLPSDARPVTGVLVSVGSQNGWSEQLRIGGVGPDAGKLQYLAGPDGNSDSKTLSGTTVLEPKTWYQVTVVREAERVRIYLNGRADPDLAGDLERPNFGNEFVVSMGGNGTTDSALEGKLSEVAIYDRPLSTPEITQHYSAAGMPEPANH